MARLPSIYIRHSGTQESTEGDLGLLRAQVVAALSRSTHSSSCKQGTWARQSSPLCYAAGVEAHGQVQLQRADARHRLRSHAG